MSEQLDGGFVGNGLSANAHARTVRSHTFVSKERTRIALSMIVKNEAHVLGRCLASVRPLITSWVIVDTGSTAHRIRRLARGRRPARQRSGARRKERRILPGVPSRLVARRPVDSLDSTRLRSPERLMRRFVA